MEQGSLMRHFRWLVSVVATLTLVVALGVWYSSTTAAAAGQHTKASGQTGGWHLIWSDNFGGSSLSGAKWNYENVDSPRNGEPEYYLPKNVSVAHGLVTLTTQKESYGGQPFTSAAVDTFQKFSFTYGKVVFSAKLPQMGTGIWPALWMLGNDCNPVGHGTPCTWPANGSNELDLMEAVQDPTTIFQTPHWGTAVGAPDQGYPAHQCTISNGTDYSASYHTYSLIWQPGGRIKWFIDGKSNCQVTAPGFFNSPMFLIMNTAIYPPTPPDSSTTLPQHFDIDYVHVYQQ